MALNITLLPPSVIAINEELSSGLHPALEIKIAESECTTAADRLAVVAAHCGVVLDGYYSGEDLAKLCDILLGKLKDMRQIAETSKLTLH
jgi:hypothetical protein